MAANTNSGQWKELGPIPDYVTTNLVCKFNEQELIFSANREKLNGLYLYNLHQQTFTIFFSFPDDLGKYMYRLEPDLQKNRLYGSTYEAPFFIIDLHKEKVIRWDEIKANQNPFEKNEDQGCGGNLLNVNGDIHWIGGCEYNTHLVWREATSTFSLVQGTPIRCIPNKMVHVPSKEIIIMVSRGIIFRHSLRTQKWEEMRSIPVSYVYESMVLTSDEKYILLSISNSPYICVLNIDNYQLYLSSVKGPLESPRFLFRTGGLKDETLVVGWIKFQFDSSEIPQPPIYLMKLIARWYSQEEVHWICKYSPRHFTINIKHILASLTTYQRDGSK